MSSLDWVCFPHIRDAILDCAIDDAHDGTIKALRLTERTVRDFIDRRIGRHIVCTVQCFSLSTLVGGIRLAFEDPTVAARVWTIDIRAGTSNCPPQPLAIPSLPNLKYARLLPGGSESLLRRLTEASTNVTLIKPLVSHPSEWEWYELISTTESPFHISLHQKLSS